jgi:hypothetical protein
MDRITFLVGAAGCVLNFLDLIGAKWPGIPGLHVRADQFAGKDAVAVASRALDGFDTVPVIGGLDRLFGGR